MYAYMLNMAVPEIIAVLEAPFKYLNLA